MKLTVKEIRRWRNQFLCDDSGGSERWRAIVTDADFMPDTFTVQERRTAPTFLAPYERDFETWLSGAIEARLRRISANKTGIKLASDLPSRIRDDIMTLLEYEEYGVPIAAWLYNQEFPYVLDRVIAWRLLSDPTQDVHQYRDFNNLGLRVLAPMLASANEKAQRSHLSGLRSLFSLAVTAGLVGLDLKGNRPMGPYVPLEDARAERGTGALRAVEDIWRDLVALADRRFAFDAFENLERDLACVSQIAWFFDDYIETGFDLLFISAVLDCYPRLRLLAIPKSGQQDNDASRIDVETMLARLAPLASLNEFRRRGRFSVARACPRMGTVNLRKLAPPLVDALATSDIVFVKGARVHELIQGGLNKTTYTAYVLTREFNESHTGLDGRLSPPLLFRAHPGERCWWGFRGCRTRSVTFADGRTISV